MSRRAPELPFWFSLVLHGSDAYAVIETTLAVTQQAAAAYDAWAARLLETGAAFVMPTHVNGSPAARLVILHPRTTIEDIQLVLDAMG